MKGSIYYIVILFCLLPSRAITERTLKGVEPLLNDKPDSALYVLNQIESSFLNKTKNKAYYALLKSIALDKNYIDVTNDSLINIAVEYYSHHGSQYNRMRSFYYQGIVCKNAQNYPVAIISFEKACQEASDINELHYLGLIHRNMGHVFNATHNYVEAINHLRQAITFFEQNKDTLYADYAKYSLAIGYRNDGHRLDSCIMLFDEVRELSIPGSLQNLAKIGLASSYVALGDSLQYAIDLFQSCPESSLSFLDHGYYALAFAKLGQLDSARKKMNLGYRAAPSATQEASFNSLVFRIDTLEGRWKDALHKVIGAMSAQDSVTRVLLRQSLSVAQKDYFQHENAMQRAQLQKQRLLFYSCSVILLLLVLGLCLVLQNRKRMQETALKEQMAQLALREQEIRKGTGVLVGALFMERVTRLCGLSNQYFIAGNDDEKKASLAQFKKASQELMVSPELFKELERSLNQYCSGIMEKLKEQVPGIKGSNRKIIALFFAGVPDIVVQAVMNRVSVGSLRTLRSRFRQIIKDANAPDETLFLSFLTTDRQPWKTN